MCCLICILLYVLIYVYAYLILVTVSVKTLQVGVFYIASQKECKMSIFLPIFIYFTPRCSLVSWPSRSKVAWHYYKLLLKLWDFKLQKMDQNLHANMENCMWTWRVFTETVTFCVLLYVFTVVNVAWYAQYFVCCSMCSLLYVLLDMIDILCVAFCAQCCLCCSKFVLLYVFTFV